MAFEQLISQTTFLMVTGRGCCVGFLSLLIFPHSPPPLLVLLLCLYHTLNDGMSTLGNDDSSVGGWKEICQRVQISNCCHRYTLLCCLLKIPEKVSKECLGLDSWCEDRHLHHAIFFQY